MIVSNSNVNVSASNQSENNKVSFNVESDANTNANTASSANDAVQNENTVSAENANSVVEHSTGSQSNMSVNTDSQTTQPVVKENQSVEKTVNVEKVAQPATVEKVQSQPVVERQAVKQPVVDEKANVSNQSVNVSSANIEKEDNNFAKTPVANAEKNVEMKPVQTQSKAVQSSNIEKNVASENEEINLATVQGEASARETASSAMDNVAPAMLNQAHNDEKRDEDMELAQNITANIKYEYNGQVVGTASETVNGDQAVDVSAHVPAGYEVSPTYKPATSVPVSNGQATFVVPVVKAQNTTPTSNKITKDVINYTNNGKTISSVTLPSDGSAVNVSAHCPSGYQVDPKYQPQSVVGKNGVATFNVPVVPASQSKPSTSGSTSSNTSVKDVINYQYNGKTVGSYTGTATGSSIDVGAHVPAGYQVAPNYKPGSANVVNGVATFNVPVVPKTNSGSTTVKPAQPASKDVINYTYNGKTISSVTLPANGSNPVNVGTHLPNGYEIAPSYKPSTVNVVNGVATFNVPVVPKSSSNTNSGSQSNPSTSGSTTVDGSDVHSTGSNQVKVTINYTYNGKTVGSATENVTSGANIDVNSHLPQGYQVAPSYKPGSQTVSGNTATINVPVEPASNSNTIKTTINYQYNGKTVGTATINNPKGQPVDVSKNVPAGYQVAPSFKPGNTKVVNGVATLDVPVVPANVSNTNGSSSSNSSSSSSSNSSSANSSSSTNKGTSSSNTSSNGSSSSSNGSTSSNTSSNNGSGMAPATSGSEGTNISGNGSNTSNSANNSNVDSDSGVENTPSDSSSDSGLAPATSGSKGTDVSGNSSNTNSANGSASGNTSSNTSAQGSTTAPATQSKPANSSNPSSSTSVNGENGSSAMAGGNSTTPGKTASDVNNGSSNKDGQSQAQSQNGSKTTVSDNGNVKTESSSNSGTADSIAALEKKTGLPAAEIKKMLAIAEANGGKAQFQNEQQHVYHVGSQGQAVAEPAGSAVSVPVEETSAPAQSASAPVETASATSATLAPASSSAASSSNASSLNALPETGMANEGIEFAAAMLAMAGIAMVKREHEE